MLRFDYALRWPRYTLDELYWRDGLQHLDANAREERRRALIAAPQAYWELEPHAGIGLGRYAHLVWSDYTTDELLAAFSRSLETLSSATAEIEKRLRAADQLSDRLALDVSVADAVGRADPSTADGRSDDLSHGAEAHLH